MALRCGKPSSDHRSCEMAYEHQGPHRSLAQLYADNVTDETEPANPERLSNGCMIYRRDR